MDSKEKLHIAGAKIMTRSSLKLFGCLYYKFDMRLVDNIDSKIKTACCYINRSTRKPTILFCEEFINSLTVAEVIYVILHEMVHFIDGHLNKIRAEEKHQEIFNLACDHIINSMLDEDANGKLSGYVSSPKENFLVPFFIGKKCALMEVYEWLMDNSEFITITIDPNSGQANVNINGKDAGNINLDLTGDPDGSANSDPDDSIDNERLTSELKDELRSIINNVLERSAGRGSNSSKIYEYIKEITKIEIPWWILLENCIESTLSKSKENRTWAQPRKRLRTLGIMLPDTDKEYTLDALYVLQDTSGSVGTKDQEKFVNIIEQSINFFSKVVIVQHDYTITNILELERDTFMLNKHKIFEVHGRGGTSHKKCFDLIEDRFFEEDEKIGLIVVLSDYESDIEQIWKNYKFHEFINMKILCTVKHTIASYVDEKPIFLN